MPLSSPSFSALFACFPWSTSSPFCRFISPFVKRSPDRDLAKSLQSDEFSQRLRGSGVSRACADAVAAKELGALELQALWDSQTALNDLFQKVVKEVSSNDRDQLLFYRFLQDTFGQ